MKRADRLWVRMKRETEKLSDEISEPYTSNTDRVNDVYNLNLSKQEVALLRLVEQTTKGKKAQ